MIIYSQMFCQAVTCMKAGAFDKAFAVNSEAIKRM